MPGWTYTQLLNCTFFSSVSSVFAFLLAFKRVPGTWSKLTPGGCSLTHFEWHEADPGEYDSIWRHPRSVID